MCSLSEGYIYMLLPVQGTHCRGGSVVVKSPGSILKCIHLQFLLPAAAPAPSLTPLPQSRSLLGHSRQLRCRRTTKSIKVIAAPSPRLAGLHQQRANIFDLCFSPALETSHPRLLDQHPSCYPNICNVPGMSTCPRDDALKSGTAPRTSTIPP